MDAPLSRPNSFHLQAAQGWLELGNFTEAGQELAQITPGLQAHLDVLMLRWEICTLTRNWPTGLDIAAALIRKDSTFPLGWILRSIALHELQRTAEARDNLLSIVHKFPLSATVRYELACYQCQLGDLDQAKYWLKQAFALGDALELKQTALEDPALGPLWQQIRCL